MSLFCRWEGLSNCGQRADAGRWIVLMAPVCHAPPSKLLVGLPILPLHVSTGAAAGLTEAWKGTAKFPFPPLLTAIATKNAGAGLSTSPGSPAEGTV